MCERPHDGYYREGRYVEPAQPQVIVNENPEMGRLLGPDGKLVKIIRAKPERAIGFQPDRAMGNRKAVVE